MMYKYICSLLLISILAACSDSISSSHVPGYETKVYSSNGGEKVQSGKYVSFELDIIDAKGELMQSMRDLPSKPILYVPTKDEDKPFNPITALIGSCSLGDSAAIFIPVDSIPEPRTFAGDNAFIEYRVKLIEMMEKDEYDTMIKEEEEKLKAEAAVIQALEADKVTEGQKILSTYLAGARKEKVQTLDNGLKYIVLSEGSGPLPRAGQSITVTYIGMLKDGSVFDNSFKAGRDFTFSIGKGQVIQGWDTGMAQIPVGGVALLDIPPAIGYGERGSPPVIPANSDLYFVVEVKDIK